MKFLILNGPNLNLLGKREPGIYGNDSYEALCAPIEAYAGEHGSTARCVQSNHEGVLIDEIQAADGVYDAIVINPGAYTHYSYAIYDALRAVSVPAYEVHISHIDRRESFRAVSVTAPACVGQVYGMGFKGYLMAMDHFLKEAEAKAEAEAAPSAPPSGLKNVKLCVIGDPVAHSLSPRIHTAMLAALEAEGSYGCETVKAEELDDFLARARQGACTGFNATMPHKQLLYTRMDRLDEGARQCQAVNTVCVEEGKLVGYNTDGAGFVAALRAMGCPPTGKKVMVLGAGGAARAVSIGLARSGARQVTVCARDRMKAADLCILFPAFLVPTGFEAGTLTKEAKTAQILVNCTSLGMTGQGQFEDFSFLDALPESAVVCDLIYHPEETELLRRALARGLRTMNGLPTLVWQGVLALEKFLGRTDLDREAMAKAAFDALSR